MADIVWQNDNGRAAIWLGDANYNGSDRLDRQGH
jgi:hypothetical protein